MSDDVVERARVWVRDVHRGSAAEIIPDLLDLVEALERRGDIWRQAYFDASRNEARLRGKLARQRVEYDADRIEKGGTDE